MPFPPRARNLPSPPIAVLGTLTLMAATGCAAHTSPPTRGPEAAVRSYVRALRADDAQAAYALLDPDTRSEVPFARFARLWKDNRSERLAQADHLARQIRTGQATEARAELPGGRSMVLIREAGRWRIDEGVSEVPSLATPRDAVLALQRALRERPLRGIERVLSRQTRASLEADIRRFLEETADPHDLQYEIRGDHAQVRTSGGTQIELVREAGEWRVVDVNLGAD